MASSRFVRSSKFRHVFGTKSKRDDCYDGFQVTRNAHDGDFCAVNTKYLAVIPEVVGGGAFYVHPLEKTGRVETNYPRVCGHRGQVFDIKWNPFDEDIIASGSEDCYIKLWQIPDGGLKENLNESAADLQGHERKVTHLAWHPTAEFLLGSAGGDRQIYLWNISEGDIISGFEHPDNILSLSWSLHGDMLASTCKDKKIRVLDPRNMERDAISFSGHDGSKNSHVIYLGDSNHLFTTGFSRMSERQYAVWDARKASKPLTMEMIDTSSGVLHPYYDPDTNMMYLAGKGDANIRFYEIVNESPYVYYLSQYQSTDSQRGIGVLPKRACDTGKCEVFRIYKLFAKPYCEVISFTVPRKSDLFQEDLFPPAFAGEPTISVDDFMAGKKAKIATKRFAQSSGSGGKVGSGKASFKKKEIKRHVEEAEEEEEKPKVKKGLKSKRREEPEEEEEPDKPTVAVSRGEASNSAEIERLREKLSELEVENAKLREENENLSTELTVRDKKITRLERQLDELDRV